MRAITALQLRAAYIAISLGVILGIAGFVMGEPGYPGVGYMEADQNLFRIIPDYLEFGSIDHLFHLLVGTFFIYSAYTFRNERRAYRKSLTKRHN